MQPAHKALTHLRKITNPMFKLGFLDGVRGFMALIVLTSHLIQRSDGPVNFLAKGGVAVDVFMLVSGILMSHNFYNRKESEPINEKATWTRFFLRRFFRIAPLYYLLLAIATPANSALQGLDGHLRGIHNQHAEASVSTAVNLLAHITFAHGLFPSTASKNILPDWSLSLEMQFYLFFPLLLVFLQRSRIITALSALVIYVTSNSLIGTFTFDGSKILNYPQPSILILKITCFIAGMMIVQLAHESRSNHMATIVTLLVLIFTQQRPTFSALAIAICYVYYYSINAKRSGALDIAGARIAELSNNILGSRIPKFLGDISYGVYLIHMLILIPVLTIAQDNHLLDSPSAWVRFIISTLLVAPPTLVVAWLAHIFIERPCIEFCRSLIHRSPRLQSSRKLN